MTPSKNLEGKNSNAWLDAIRQTGNDVDIIFCLVHSNLFDAGMKVVEQLKEEYKEEYPNVKKWPTQNIGISVIANRRTLYHRDKGGNPTMYDFLVSAGTHTSCCLELPDVNATLAYKPGTVVALCGKVLKHGVRDWEGGERLCYAFYSRDNVHSRLDIQRTDWPQLQMYEGYFSSGFLDRQKKYN